MSLTPTASLSKGTAEPASEGGGVEEMGISDVAGKWDPGCWPVLLVPWLERVISQCLLPALENS